MGINNLLTNMKIILKNFILYIYNILSILMLFNIIGHNKKIK